MAIILEFNDYKEVHEAMEMVNEGFFGEMWNRLKDAFKGVSGDVDAAIASGEIDTMLDPKTGALTNAPAKAISRIDYELKNKDATAEDVKGAVEAAFSDLEKMVKAGAYYKQNLKFMKDSVITLMDQAASMKTAGAEAGKTAEEKGKEEQTGTSQAAAMQTGVSEQMKQRYAEFKKTYDAAKAKAKQNATAAVQNALKKAGADKTKLFINNRFATAETVLLLIEYDILKLRVGPENLADLKNQMVQSYKVTLDSAKQLQQAVTMEKAPKMTPEAYDKLDINAFMKEYPAEAVKAGADIKEYNIYPYSGTDGIAIAAYDVNEKTVGFYTINKTVIDDNLQEEKFDTFKQQLLAGSNNVPPVKQKGGYTAPEAKPAPGGTKGEVVK